MAVLTMIAVIIGAWCAAAVAAAALYVVLRARHVRRQRTSASRADGTVRRSAPGAGSGDRDSCRARTAPVVVHRTAPDGA
ncbi:hypothetical protein [Streptomyces sp. NPDC005533]|uniref:hypothetical protein n=1 Tax=Streptomyces sp. NPDC005533 TaxID=3364723 RepID=UPI0036CBAC04